MDHVPSSFLSVTLRYWKNIRCRKRFSLAFAGTGLKSSNHIYVQQLNTNMRRNIEIFISGRASSTRPGTERLVYHKREQHQLMRKRNQKHILKNRITIYMYHQRKTTLPQLNLSTHLFVFSSLLNHLEISKRVRYSLII